MAATSWMIRQANARSARFPGSRHANKEDEIHFDIKKDPRENITDILSSLCQINDTITDGKRLNYLNAFVKVTLLIEGNFESIGFKISDILTCLRITLIHHSTQVRSGGLRAIRHILRNDDDIIQLNLLLIPFLVARSLDLVLRNDVERIEAMKLVRKILLVSPGNFHVALARSLVALANGGVEEKDRMLRICLATLCELGVLNTNVFIETGGVTAITRNLLECQTPKIAEALCGVLLLLLDKPATRTQAAIDLHCVAAPYCDFHYRHAWKDKDKYVDERDLRFNCSRLALLSILRSWPGIQHFCSPANKGGLKAIVQVLYLNQLEVRKAVLDLLYELLGLPQPDWTDELSVALSAIDPSEPQSSWRLNEGFVAAEGRSILPHLAKTTPSISDMHLALLLYCFLECGLLGAIVEVMSTSDTFISVRATVLLGELLHLIQMLLPPECCNISPGLPSLLEYATIGQPQAAKAVNGLQQLHKLLRNRPASYSLHLDFILRSGENAKFSSRKQTAKTSIVASGSRHRLKSLKSKIQQWVVNDCDEIIKETGVLINKDDDSWNWNYIRIILRDESISIDLNDAAHKNFFKRLLEFYMPSNNRYSHMDLHKIGLAYTLTAIELIQCLLRLDCDDSLRMISVLFSDISVQIEKITSGKSVHDCLFSPQHMNTTQCQSYFLFIGRLATHHVGMKLLNDLNVFSQLEHLAVTTKNDCYVKLIVSSLDYSEKGAARTLLKSVLCCQVENSRLYATQFLLVLLRAQIHDFHDWGMEYLVKQLQDESRAICLTALNVLHEACENKQCLETIIKLNPDVSQLGEKGEMLRIRYLSIASGFALLERQDCIAQTMKKWNEHLNFRYVKLVEGETSDILTLHQRDDGGKYDKRTTSVRSVMRKDLFLPPHLYGQLGQHADGSLMLIRSGALEVMVKLIQFGLCETDDDIMRLKAALWALGHFGSTSDGLLYLILHNCLYLIISLVENCQVLSIRATAYYVLGLIASNRLGADELFKLGWFCTRHNRHVMWPIIEEERWSDDEESVQADCVYPDKFSDLLYFDPAVLSTSTTKDESTDDDNSESLTAMVHSPANQKSLTLPPVNQNAPTSQHKRSLSESKTFEMIRAHVNKAKEKGSFRLSSDLSRRIRHNSTTESTTSGVSSCDSVYGGKSTIYERQAILSPIPSSCSLSTLKHAGPKMRRHSESSRRTTSSSTTTSTSTFCNNYEKYIVSNSTTKLSHQDLMGYNTWRTLRKSPRYLEDSDDLHNAIFMTDSGAYDSPSTSSKRYSISEAEDGQCYMGITLPQDVCNLFLENYNNRNGDSSMKLDKSLEFEEEISMAVRDLSLNEEKSYEHDFASCLFCSTNGRGEKKEFATTTSFFGDSFQMCDPNSEDSVVRGQVLRLVEQFSNPVWNKQVRQSLLQNKQRSPHIFQDVCVYSEVCKMISESTYRLSPRRILHELFFEVNYEEMYKDCLKLVEQLKSMDLSKLANCTHNEQKQESGGQSNIKKLDTLKLAYKENKFPIRNRKVSIPS